MRKLVNRCLQRLYAMAVIAFLLNVITGCSVALANWLRP